MPERPAEILPALRSRGYAVLSEVPEETWWLELAATLGLRKVEHPSRPASVVGVAGEEAVSLHADLGRTPYRPEVLGLVVERLSAGSAAYTVVDSASKPLLAAAEKLPPEIHYSFKLSTEAIRKARPQLSPAEFPATEIGRAVDVAQCPGDKMRVRFAVATTQRSILCGAKTSPLSIRGPYPGAALDKEGEALDPDLVEATYDVFVRNSFQVEVRERSVLVVDNARMLHGRPPWPHQRLVRTVMLGRCATPFG
jgi:hypothetical protein